VFEKIKKRKYAPKFKPREDLNLDGWVHDHTSHPTS